MPDEQGVRDVIEELETLRADRRNITSSGTGTALHIDQEGSTSTNEGMERFYAAIGEDNRTISNDLSEAYSFEGTHTSDVIEIDLNDDDIQEWKLEMYPGSMRSDTASIVLNDGTVVSGNIHELSVNPMLGTEDTIAHILFVAESEEVVTLKLNVRKDENGEYIWRGTKQPIKDWSKEF